MFFSAILSLCAIVIGNVWATRTLILLYGASKNTTQHPDELAAMDVDITRAILGFFNPPPEDISVAVSDSMCSLDFGWVLKNYKTLGWNVEDPDMITTDTIPNDTFDRILHLGPLCEYYAIEAAEFEMVNYISIVIKAFNNTPKNVAHFFASPSMSVNMIFKNNLDETVNAVAEKWKLPEQLITVPPVSGITIPPFFAHLTGTADSWAEVIFNYGSQHMSHYTVVMSAVEELASHVDVFCRNLFDRIMVENSKKNSNFSQFTFVGEQSSDDFLEIWHQIHYRTRRVYFCGDIGIFHDFLLASKRLNEVDQKKDVTIKDFGIYYIMFGADETNGNTWPIFSARINKMIKAMPEVSYHVKIVSLNAPLKCGSSKSIEKFCHDFYLKILHNSTKSHSDIDHDRHDKFHTHSRYDLEASFYALAIHQMFTTVIHNADAFWTEVKKLQSVKALLNFDIPAISVYDILPHGTGEFKLKKKCEFSEQGIVPPSECTLDWNGKEPYGDPNPCGYESCDNTEAPWRVVIGILAAIIGTGVLISFLIVYFYLRYKRKQEWLVQPIGDVRLKIEDIKPIKSFPIEAATKRSSVNADAAASTLRNRKSAASIASKETTSKSLPQKIYLDPVTLASVPGLHTTFHVLVKPFKGERNHERQVTEIVTKYRELNLENVAKIHGYVVQVQPFVYGLVMESGDHGALIDLLQLDELDLTLKLPLLADLCRGLEHIHKNNLLKYHGNLSSQCCVVDSHFVLKIQVHEIRELKNLSPIPMSSKAISSAGSVEGGKGIGGLWTAPEILRHEVNVDMKLADIYSFGIIAHEIIYQKGPFYLTGKDAMNFMQPAEHPPKDLEERAKFVEKILEDKNRRPVVPSFVTLQAEETVMVILKDVMSHCWSTTPGQRWPLKKVGQQIKKTMDDLKIVNVFSTMMQRLEFYSKHLQEAVQQKAEKIEEERRRVRTVLDKLFPGGIAKKLIDNQRPQPKAYQKVCVYFNDIVGFTKFCSVNEAPVVVKYLNQLFTGYDKVIELYNIHPVTRIGDAYMLVAGIPIETNEVSHAMEIAQAALQMVEVVKRLVLDKDAVFEDKESKGMKIRSGIASGNAAAGVVGREIPSYCICGPAVTTANKMEHDSEPYRILVAESAFILLKEKFDFEPTPKNVKINDQLGFVNAYWMKGMKNVKTIVLDKRLDGKNSNKTSDAALASSSR